MMTGHVAQFFLDDEIWNKTLLTIYSALRTGGYFAFESRNPMVQPWADDRIEGHPDWPSPTSRRKVNDPIAGQVEWWVQLCGVRDNQVRYELHYRFIESGEELISVDELKFRTQAELSQSLENAGFSIESVYGDWDGRPASVNSPEFIYLAKRRA
jgi:hypothetical protein